MKTRAHSTSRSGGVLVATLIVCMLVGIMLVAYLALVSQQQIFTQRSQIWNHCIPMCEAGIEEAMAHLNHSSTSNDFAINGWKFEAGAYRKERDLNNGTWFVAIDTKLPPVITAVGSLRIPLQKASYVTRTVEVQTKFNQQFPNGMLARGAIKMGGNSALIDSFNSTNSNESTTGGQYDPDKATDHASIATVSQNAGDLYIGNVDVYGTVGTGPGGTVTVGANGNVGSADYIDSGSNSGTVEADHSTDDVNVYIAPASLPDDWGSPQSPSSDKDNKYILGNGDYQINGSVNLTGKDVISVRGKARLLVTGNTSVGGGNAYIKIEPGGSVEWYAAGNVSIGGGGVVNYPGFAKNFSMIGLPTCTSVSFTSNEKFVGTIYAPNADVTLAGNGDFMGAVVGKTITVMGTVAFHYDEALRGNPKHGRFFVSSWREL
jgi:hypothetical protein